MEESQERNSVYADATIYVRSDACTYRVFPLVALFPFDANVREESVSVDGVFWGCRSEKGGGILDCRGDETVEVLVEFGGEGRIGGGGDFREEGMIGGGGNFREEGWMGGGGSDGEEAE